MNSVMGGAVGIDNPLGNCVGCFVLGFGLYQQAWNISMIEKEEASGEGGENRAI